MVSSALAPLALAVSPAARCWVMRPCVHWPPANTRASAINHVGAVLTRIHGVVMIVGAYITVRRSLATLERACYIARVVQEGRV